MDKTELFKLYCTEYETNRERIKFLLGQVKNELYEIERKSQHKFMELKQLGNDAYEKKQFRSALDYYTQSLVYAPYKEVSENGEDCLSIGYGNRSSVLFELKQYGAALRDVDRAFKYGYNKNKRYKLFIRKIKCLIASKQYSKANDMLNECKDIVMNGEQSMDQFLKLQDEIKEKFRANPSVSDCDKDIALIPKDKIYPQIIVQKSDSRGRFIVAAEDIQTGK